MQGTAKIVRCCTDWATDVAGSYAYTNNVWNKAKASGPYEQCLLVRNTATGQERGWSWRWPGTEKMTFAFPEICFGKKPWTERSTDPRLPTRLSELKELSVHYDVETRATGSHALTLGTWLTSDGARDRQTWKTIVAEVSVMLDFGRDDSPKGNRTGSLDVLGTTYELWLAANHGDRGDGIGWTYYTLKPSNPTPFGTVPLAAILVKMQAERRWDPGLFVSSIEFGNEIVSGSGTTWVKRYEVELEVSD